MDRLTQSLAKEQSILELIRDVRALMRGQLDGQVKIAYEEQGIGYDLSNDKVKSFRIGRISLEERYPAIVVFPINEVPVNEGEGVSTWDYNVGLDGYITAKRGIEEVLDEKIIQMKVAVERLLLPLFPGRGKITSVQYADVVSGDALLNAFSLVYMVRIAKVYAGVPA